MTTRSGRARRLAALLVPVALLASSGLVYKASTAAFTATTVNSGNSWEAGTISLTDDDTGTAAFNLTGLKPGDTGSRCIVVTYGGNIASQVALYGTVGGTGLATYLNLSVETGTGGTFSAGAPCTGFTSTASIYSGTLAGFASKADFATGVPASSRWSPSTAGSTRVYRFTWSVVDDNLAQGKNATANFTWEAQST